MKALIFKLIYKTKGVLFMKQYPLVIFLLFTLIILSSSNFAQDATVVDPEHYKVEFENEQVRVLRINYNAGEKGEMHSHPEGVAIFLSDGSGKFTYSDGKTEEMSFKSGQVVWLPATTHQGENTGDNAFEVIQIEIKNKE
jgi:quercetin dioxygenase-like cupin family protein